LIVNEKEPIKRNEKNRQKEPKNAIKISSLKIHENSKNTSRKIPVAFFLIFTYNYRTI